MEAISVEQVRNSLKQCMDPEVPLSIVAVSYTHLTLPTNREV